MVCSFKLHFVSKNLKIKDITKRSYKREKNKEKRRGKGVCVCVLCTLYTKIYLRTKYNSMYSDNRLERKSVYVECKNIFF